MEKIIKSPNEHRDEQKLSEQSEIVALKKVDSPLVEKILNNLHIPGDNPALLSLDIIKKEGLIPKYCAKIEDREFAFSAPYDLGQGRVGVVAFVKLKNTSNKPGEFYVSRSYYRSNSHGIWRYLPDYMMNEYGEVTLYGKGHNQKSLNLPFELQRILAEIRHLERSKTMKVENPENIIAGSAVVSRLTDYGYTPDRDDYYYEVKKQPERLTGKFYGSSYNKIPPEDMIIKYESPVFSKVLFAWEDESDTQGKFLVEVFPSVDGKFNFAFCRSSVGRAWIGGIEVVGSKITSTGLRADWVDGGFLMTPPVEYFSEAGDYAGKRLKGPYVDMFENYLSKIPVIQEYLRSVEKWKKG